MSNKGGNASRRLSGAGGGGSGSMNTLDLSGRSTGSNRSFGSSNSHTTANNNNFMFSNQQQQFAAAAAVAFPGSPQQQQQQRMFQMQMQQHQLQLQQLQRQNQLASSHAHAQQQQRRSSFGSSSTLGTASSSATNTNTAALSSPNALVSGSNSTTTNTNNTLLTNALPAPPMTMVPGVGGLIMPASQTTTNSKQELAPSSAITGTAPSSSAAGVAGISSGSGSKRNSTVSLPPLSLEKSAVLLKQCDWIDKTLWASRQLLGGQSVNGFLRSTATAQRIKKQRARQVHKTAANAQNKKQKTLSTTSTTSTTASTTTSATNVVDEQAAEEELKKEIMNARFAKKLKTEFEHGVQFCALLHNTIRSLVREMDPSLPPIPPLLSQKQRNKQAAARQLQQQRKMKTSTSTTTSTANKPSTTIITSTTTATATATGATIAPPSLLQRETSTSSTSTAMPSSATAASAGNPSGSTLRRNRKKKLPPSGEPSIDYPEFVKGKRICPKKEYTHRMAELTRFRALKKGDAVAARVSSRDLWILARVVQDYPGYGMNHADFLQLSEARREQHFKTFGKVQIQDVEEGTNAAVVPVARSLVLPLPRSVSEASEWTRQRLKKACRVYAMYPHTTSLYTATVVDSTTYCRGDDDIVVVEFDGDEKDASGKTPACHIPARFVTLIPREFPGAAAAQQQSSTSGGGSKKKSSSTTAAAATSKTAIVPAPDDDALNGAMLMDDMNFDGALPGLEGFDELDFDLLGDS